MKHSLLLLIILIACSTLSGYEFLKVGDIPTAGILQYGEVQVSTKIYRDNGILIGSSVGIFPRFMFGVSYGGENIVGNKKPVWNEKVEVHAKYRILDESPSLPALVVGYDSQGHGTYHTELKRYDIKSKGFYTAVSRNYLFMGNLGLHFGINYSLENKDGQHSLNCFLGFDKSLGEELTLTVDYDAALNDQQPDLDKTYDDTLRELLERKGNGYLNLSFIMRVSDSLTINIIAYDLLENNPLTVGADRAIKINYNMKF